LRLVERTEYLQLVRRDEALAGHRRKANQALRRNLSPPGFRLEVGQLEVLVAGFRAQCQGLAQEMRFPPSFKGDGRLFTVVGSCYRLSSGYGRGQADHRGR